MSERNAGSDGAIESHASGKSGSSLNYLDLMGDDGTAGGGGGGGGGTRGEGGSSGSVEFTNPFTNGDQRPPGGGPGDIDNPVHPNEPKLPDDRAPIGTHPPDGNKMPPSDFQGCNQGHINPNDLQNNTNVKNQKGIDF